MVSTLKEILNWSEVWALLIPLAVLLLYRNTDPHLKPVRIYIIAGLVLNLFIDIIANLKQSLGITRDDFLWNNNFLYNIQSVIRFYLFSWFFLQLNQQFMSSVKKALPVVFTLLLGVNFIFFENFIPQGDYESFSSRLLATESAFLLFYCLQYFIYIILDDKTTKLSQNPGFWVVAGLSLYVSVNFFIYLFYTYLVKATRSFAISIWDVHNIVFIIFCLFLTKQFLPRGNSKNLETK